MGKLVVLKIGAGSFAEGFSVTLQLGEDGARSTVELPGRLPQAPDLPAQYHDWQSAYRRLGYHFRIEFPPAEVTNVSRLEECCRLAQVLSDRLNDWLNSELFRPIRERLFEKLVDSDSIRVLVQTEDYQLQQLPWHQWHFFERFPNAEVALSAPYYEPPVETPANSKPFVKILAILGNSTGIDIQKDRAVLEALPDAETQLLVEPTRQDLNDELWSQSWDILFFAGHSMTRKDDNLGQIAINPRDRLALRELKHALQVAIRSGLKLAIFNSCDGLGLAQQLADLHIPQVIVMREPVPDQVAQKFLNDFLTAFSTGQMLYTSVRQARERLEALEDQFPCATWLPVIFQNPAELPWQWQPAVPRSKPRFSDIWHGLKTVLLTSAISITLVAGVRYAGWLQPLELQAYDQLMRLRSPETTDPRLLVITVTEQDIQAQSSEPRQGSLSDKTLMQLFFKLERYQPQVIGLDIYRDYPANLKELSTYLQHNQRLVAICKVSDRNAAVNDPGMAPPPEVPAEQLGFSDFLLDPDGILRRHLLVLEPSAASACTAPYAFSVQIAARYLATKGISTTWNSNGNLQLGSLEFSPLNPHMGGYQTVDTRGYQIMLNYRAPLPQETVEQVSLSDLLSDRIQRDRVTDRIVLIGVTAYSSGDFWSTPFSAGSLNTSNSLHQKTPGVLMQAAMVSQILSAVLDQRPLIQPWAAWKDILWIGSWAVVGGGVVWWMQQRYESIKQLLIPLGLAVAATTVTLGGLCLVFLIQGAWVPLVPSLVAIALTGGIILMKNGK